MAGQDVTRNELDSKAALAIIAIRDAFRQVKIIKGFLDQYPADTQGGDPLTLSTSTVNLKEGKSPGKFGYTADEAYLLRNLFNQLNALEVQPLLDIGKKLTGLS